VVEKVKDKLAASKQRSRRLHMEGFNLKKLKEVEGKEQCHVEVSDRFAAWEDLVSEVDINSSWEFI
jgi:hypothetical protein